MGDKLASRGFRLRVSPEVAAVWTLPAALAAMSCAAVFVCLAIHWS